MTSDDELDAMKQAADAARAMPASITLSNDELQAITGYRQISKQLPELHRQGFYRARRSAAGGLILERAHYEAVAAGLAPLDRPKLKLTTGRSAGPDLSKVR